MYKVEGTTIRLTRGDTARIKVDITDADGNPYIPDKDDIIKFAVKRQTYDKQCVIEKLIPYDTMLLEIKPEDTKDLSFGKYVYDMQITLSDGTVCTFITASILQIEEEVCP